MNLLTGSEEFKRDLVLSQSNLGLDFVEKLFLMYRDPSM